MLKIKEVIEFYKQVKQESRKVVWITKKEIWTSTLIVLSAVAVFSVLCLILDYTVHSAIQFLLNIGK